MYILRNPFMGMCTCRITGCRRRLREPPFIIENSNKRIWSIFAVHAVAIVQTVAGGCLHWFKLWFKSPSNIWTDGTEYLLFVQTSNADVSACKSTVFVVGVTSQEIHQHCP